MIDVGLIGFGLAGRYFHAPVIRAVPGLRVAAILQRTGDSAGKLYPEARIVRTLDDLLAVESLKLIVIATPNPSHVPIAKRCLEAGRHVVVDKPFTLNVAEARELITLARSMNLVLTVYHDRRFDADFQGLRKVIDSGELGRVTRFESTYDRYRPTPKPGSWREQPGPGGGIFFDLSPHLLDQSFTLLGTPEAVTADMRTERAGFTTDDAFDVLLHYPQGTRALLRATMLAAWPRPRTVVLAQNGSYLKRDFDPLELTLRAGHVPQGESWALEKEENWGELTLIKDGHPTTSRVPSTGDWRDFYANVRDAILGVAPILVTPQQILDVMVAMELALESSSERRTVPWRHFDA
jgi:scyllo-inositol 2-dehydrogenase (NADP+)